MSELKPCPFCGGEAIRDTITMACCRNCFATTTISKWNTRHTPDGWRLVPKEATRDMVKAAMDRGAAFGAGAHYAAMLKAAPSPGQEV